MKNGEGIKKDCPKLKGKCYQSGSDSNKKEQIDLIGNWWLCSTAFIQRGEAIFILEISF